MNYKLIMSRARFDSGESKATGIQAHLFNDLFSQ